MERHFCVTVYVQNPIDQRFLMVLHRKLNKWVPPGGHVDENEIPDTAAIRETAEETGVSIELLGRRSPAESCLVTPYGIQQNIILAGEHEHLDLIYFAKPIGATELTLNDAESLGIGWFSADEIMQPDFKTFETVKQWTRFFAQGAL